MRSYFVLFVLALAACGGDGATLVDASIEPDAAPRQIVMENVPLVVNAIEESKLVGGPGDIARIRVTAPSESLDWNIHAHPNGMTVVVSEGFRVMTVDYVFAPNMQADWYLLLRNKGQTDMTVQLTIELYENLMWSGWL